MRPLAWLLVPACATSPAQAPTQGEVDDVAKTLGATLAGAGGELEALDDAVAIAHGMPPVGFFADGGRITGDHLGMHYVFELSCRGDAGEGVACGPGAETAVARVSSVGTVGLPGFTASGARASTWTLGGLHDAVTMVDGTTAFTFDAASYHLADRVTHTRVAIEIVSGAPIGGDVRADVAGMHVLRELDVGAGAAFHADRTAELVLDGRYRFALDIASGAVTPAP